MQKKNGELRLRINLTHSNKQIKRENFKLQTNSDKLNGSQILFFFPNWMHN